MFPKLDKEIKPIKNNATNVFDLISVPITGQTSSQQDKDLVLILKLVIRDQIIAYLNDCSAILNEETQFKGRLTKQFRNLVPNLVSLKIRKQDEPPHDFDMNASNKDYELILDLSSDLKNQLIAHLIKNLDLCIRYSEFATDKMKKDLVYENNEFIQMLLNLPFGFLKKEDTKKNCSSLREMNKVLNEVDLFRGMFF